MGRALLAPFVLLAYASIVPCVAQVKGPSYIGFCSPRWPCKESLTVFEGQEVKATGWLVGTFGDKCPCADAFLKTPGRKYVRVTLANCTCFPERGRKCGEGEPFRGETIASADKKLRRRDPVLLYRYRRNLKLAKRSLKYVDVETDVRVSLCLESEFSGQARKVLLREAQRAFQYYRYVDSVVGKRCLPGLICEKHGARPRVNAPCIVDTDGQDYRAGFSSPRHCEASFLWWPGANLLHPGRSSFVPPRERTNAPTERDFEQLKRALR